MAEDKTLGLVLVENVIVANQIISLLRRAGYSVRQALGDDDALEFLRDNDVSVVVADIDATGMDGLALLAWCKRERPGIAAYAVCQANSGRCLSAHVQGVDGFFYLAPQRHQLDARHGIARQLLQAAASEQPWPQRQVHPA